MHKLLTATLLLVAFQSIGQISPTNNRFKYNWLNGAWFSDSLFLKYLDGASEDKLLLLKPSGGLDTISNDGLSQDLQSVTDQGNQTNNGITVLSTNFNDSLFLNLNNNKLLQAYENATGRRTVRIGKDKDHLNTQNFTDGLQIGGDDISDLFPQVSIIAGADFPRVRLSKIGESRADTIENNETVSRFYSTVYNPSGSLISLSSIETQANEKIRGDSLSSGELVFKVKNQGLPNVPSDYMIMSNGQVQTVVNAAFNGNMIDGNSVPLSDGQALVSNGTKMIATNVSETISQTTNLDFGSISDGASATLNVTVDGADVGDVTIVNAESGFYSTDLILQAYVSAANTVVIKASNYTGAAVDPAAFDFDIKVFK